MKKEDLRIGNLVYDSLRNKEVKIQLKHFKELYISEKMFFERYKSIELTEKKLLNMGFEKIKYQMSLNNGSMNFHYQLKDNNSFKVFFNGKWFTINQPNISPFEFRHNIYIHQLQNFFFCASGEELPIA